jgi:hypothetical protein
MRFCVISHVVHTIQDNKLFRLWSLCARNEFMGACRDMELIVVAPLE